MFIINGTTVILEWLDMERFKNSVLKIQGLICYYAKI